MDTNINIWLERLNSLYTSQKRQAAAAEGMQTVHLEILLYLSICNEYSNTAQALSEYLGQTKSSISQSLKIMTRSGHIDRKPDIQDKRIYKLSLTEKGKLSLSLMTEKLFRVKENQNNCEQIQVIKTLLKTWQHAHNHTGFGQCITCKFNIKKSQNDFQCGLTGLALLKSETTKICKEHQFQLQI